MRVNNQWRWLWCWPKHFGSVVDVLVRFDLTHVSFGFELNGRDRMATCALGPAEVVIRYRPENLEGR